MKSQYRHLCLILFTTIFFGASPAHSSEEITFYHNDALGSPVLATDANGDVKWREQYTSYGSRLLYESRETDCSTPPCEQVDSLWDEKQWYTGKLEEARVGLQYFGARWYDPSIGRFLSIDPVEFQESNVFTFNRYAYANNNPYKYVDPNGKEVVQVGFSMKIPAALGLGQKLLGRDIEVSGFSAGIAWSSPDISNGRGEFDIGGYMTVNLNAGGLDSGRISLDYSESIDQGATVKDLAGISGAASLNLGAGGLNASYSLDGIESLGIHVGPGVGVEAHGEATGIISFKHGRQGWNTSKSSDKRESKSTKKNELK